MSVMVAELEPVIQDMLDAGADPLTQDIRGNTALHYIAACGLANRYGVESRSELLRHLSGVAFISMRAIMLASQPWKFYSRMETTVENERGIATRVGGNIEI